MPFRYTAPESPYVGTIAELMQRGPQAQADAALRIGQAQAQGAQQQGAAWAGAVQNIGQDVAGTIKGINAYRAAAPQRELQGLQIQQARQSLTEQSQKFAEDLAAKKDQHNRELLSAIGMHVHELGNTPEALQSAFNAGEQAGLLTPEDVQSMASIANSDPTKIPLLSQSMIGATKEGRDRLEKTVTGHPGDVIQKEFTGETLLNVPEKKPDYTVNGQRFRGDGTPIGPPVPAQHPPAPHSLEEQLLEAIGSGDTAKATQIKQTLHDAADAKKDPAAKALADQLGGLRADEARARLDAMNKKAEPLDISPDVQTTHSGRTYLDLSSYAQGDRNKAREAAAQVGAIPVSKEQADALQNIDNARMNQASILAQVKDIAATSPVGRVGNFVSVPLAKLFQTNEQIAAFNTWRTAAIQTMRATAGSKGLRINRSEIEQAIENDIPQLTDTWGVAQQKVKNVNAMLENAEQSILVRDRSAMPSPTPPDVKLAPNTIKIVSQGGVTYRVTTDANGNVISSVRQ